jgi:hypothetical protein
MDTKENGLFTELYHNEKFMGSVFRNMYGELILTGRKIDRYTSLGEHLLTETDEQNYIILMCYAKLHECMTEIQFPCRAKSARN